MKNLETRPAQGLRLHDLIGLVVGYSMAALLARSFWPRSKPLAGIPGIALGFEFCWLGLAMSGPIILLLGRRGTNPSPDTSTKRPIRPGLRMVSGEAVDPPVGRDVARSNPEPPPNFTRAELAWMVIGGYWIGLTLFVVPALSIDTPWALVGLLQVVAAIGLWVVIPRRGPTSTPPPSWTHRAAVGLIATWPFAWVFLILLSRSF